MLEQIDPQQWQNLVFSTRDHRAFVQLATTLLIGSVLYGVVALTGRKPEWHTLLTICVFAGFVEVLRLLTTLLFMLRFRTVEVDTSLGLLARLMAGGEHANPQALAGVWGMLTALDPFRIWFWLVVIVGLAVTAQLRGWRAWVSCSLCWLIGAAGRAAWAVGMAAQAARGAGQA